MQNFANYKLQPQPQNVTIELVFFPFYVNYWTLDISQTASYEITFVRLSVRPSLSFLKIGSLVFCDIVHDDRWPW